MVKRIKLDKPTESQLEALNKFKSLEIAARIATRDLIRMDELTQEEKDLLVAIYPKWESGKLVKIGEIYKYNNILYEVIQEHTTQIDWTPDIVPALFKSHTPLNIIEEWVQPTGAHDAYNIGDKVLFEGSVYESLINANTWSPTVYPAGWQLIE
jgi:hypothetical protein